jgi:hypothetical protein
MNIGTIEAELSDINRKFSLAEYEKLKPSQKATFKQQLKEAIAKLRRSYVVAMMDDDYLFEFAGTKANYTIMQMITDWKELGVRKKNSAIQGNPAQQADLVNRQLEMRKQLIQTLFGSHALFNKVNEKTIAIDQVMLNTIVG